MAKYSMSFWNYVSTGAIDSVQAVQDWEKLGMNLAMSFTYDYKKHKKEDLIKMLDECWSKNIKVIICDRRTDFLMLTALKMSREDFEKGVQEAVADFGSHPATFGFHIGDEPSPEHFDDVVFVHKTVKKAAPNLTPFINLLPMWIDGGFEEVMGCKPQEYGRVLDKLVKAAGLEILCYDCYAQCSYFEKEKFQDVYFQNLQIFGEVARANNIPLYTSLLSVGHWSVRCPNEDDFRWQLSTATAMGVTGFAWFFIYERFLDGSFRTPPIDLFWEKTETFEWLSRQNRIFMKFIAPKLENYIWDCVKTVNMDIFNQERFKIGDFGITELKVMVNENAPLMIARFKGESDELFVVVNVDRQYPTRIELAHRTNGREQKVTEWLSPGQMLIRK